MALEKLINGFKTFRAAYFGKDGAYKQLVNKGQSPAALVIACSDSRNDPALLTQSEPGDIFVVRNVAAIVPPYHPDEQHHGTSAAIEFAVRGLKVTNIIVLGHALCGGVAMLGRENDPQDGHFEFLSQWMNVGKTARETVDRLLPQAEDEDRAEALEQAVVLTSLNNLMTFPWIKSGVAEGRIALHGWYFDMVHGRLLAYDFVARKFNEVKSKTEGYTWDLLKQGCCSPWQVEDMVRAYTAFRKA